MINISNWKSVDSTSYYGHNTAKIAPLMLLVVATGSSYSADRVQEWQPYVKSRVPIQIDQAQNTSISKSEELVNSLSLADKINLVRQTFLYGVSDLAKLLGISRQAIYKWNNNHVTPEPLVSKKIDNFTKLAISLSRAGVERAGEVVKLKYFDGQSLLDKAILDNISEDELEELLSYIREMQSDYNQISRELSEPARDSEWLSSQSLPYNGA